MTTCWRVDLEVPHLRKRLAGREVSALRTILPLLDVLKLSKREIALSLAVGVVGVLPLEPGDDHPVHQDLLERRRSRSQEFYPQPRHVIPDLVLSLRHQNGTTTAGPLCPGWASPEPGRIQIRPRTASDRCLRKNIVIPMARRRGRLGAG